MIVDTYGVSIRLALKNLINGTATEPVDLTGWTAAALIIKSPSGVRSVKTATVIDAPGGVVEYVTQDGDFSTTGNYRIQAVVDIGATKHWKSSITEIKVTEEL